MSDERMQILRMIEEKRITPDEGAKLLEALVAEEENDRQQTTDASDGGAGILPSGTEIPTSDGEILEETSPAQAAPPDFPGFGHLWLIPLAVGGVLTTIGLGASLLIQLASPGSFFLICGLMPFLLGLGVILLAFWSRTAHWLHIRIRGEQRISLSFPLPLRLAGWILRLVRPYVPQLEETGLDEVILSLDEGLAGEGGFFVDVQDDEDGEHVQVYIG